MIAKFEIFVCGSGTIDQSETNAVNFCRGNPGLSDWFWITTDPVVWISSQNDQWLVRCRVCRSSRIVWFIPCGLCSLDPCSLL